MRFTPKQQELTTKTSKRAQIKYLLSPAADMNMILGLTLVRALVDGEEQVQDEIQVDLLIIEAVMIRFEQLLVLRIQLGSSRLNQRRLVQLTCFNTPSVHTHTHTPLHGL